MRRIIFISTAGLILIFVIGVTANTVFQKSKDAAASTEAVAAEQWEYLVVQGGTTNLSSSTSATMRKENIGAFREAFPLESNLDKLGEKGWELVTVYGSQGDPVYFFKRRK
ncbi:MAG: hypothetical protein AB1757_08800 [Acidobacteriota bacterium]